MSIFRRGRAGRGPTEAATAGPLSTAPHLLVCDDNASVTKLLEMLFDRAGWTVEVTDTGRECLRALARRVPDVIVLDQRFYFGLNGLETAELARDGGFDRPIILFSAHLDAAAQQWAEELQVLPVSKVDTPAVVRLVNEAHRSYRARTAKLGLRQRLGTASSFLETERPGEAPA